MIGLDLSLRRSATYKIVGFQALWDGHEANITRGLVAEHTIMGQSLRFFVADDNDLIQQCHLMGSFFEEAELKVIADNYRGGTFLDVGANVGNHSLFAATILQAPRVIAFEPNPPAFRILQYNVLLNALTNTIEVRPLGLSDSSTQATVVRSPVRNLGATRLAPSTTGNLVLVQGDGALAGEPVSFIKIDVESLEMKVLAGLVGTISAHRPVLFVEVDDSNRNSFQTFLQDHGYLIRTSIELDGNANVLAAPA